MPKADPEGSATPTAVNPPVPTTVDEKPAEDPVPVVSKADSPTLVAQVNGSAPVVKRENRKSESEKEDRDKEKRPRSRLVDVFISYIYFLLLCICFMKIVKFKFFPQWTYTIQNKVSFQIMGKRQAAV